MRAVTQNRAMAAEMGIRTARVDALTFGLGAGIAGLAGVALSQIDNVSPNLGQGYIIDSFLVVVFGGAGNLWGTFAAAFSLGIANKFLEPCRRRGARQDPDPRLHHPLHPEAAARAVPAARPGGGGVSMTERLIDRRTGDLPRAALRRHRRWCPAGNLLAAPGSGMHVPSYIVALLGKYLCYALLAVALDLVWGCAGILSLGHGAFFALGGYAMGMHLMREIGDRGVYANPELPDFMVFLSYTELPWFWHGFDMFWFACLMVLFVPGLLAFVFGWFAFRSRVTGVYLSIITQALTFALMLAFFRNEMGFGGNNGLTDFRDVLGFPPVGRHDAGGALRAFGAGAGARASARAGDHRLEVRQGAGGGARRGEPDAVPRLPGRALQALRLRGLGDARRARRRALRAAGRDHQPERVLARRTRSRS